MTTNTEKYTQELIFALRMRDVAGDRIGEIVAEVESHCAETGEDPREAFGTAKDYALAVSPGRVRWITRSVIGGLVLGAVAGWLLAQSVGSLIRGERALYGIPTWGALLLALAIGAWTYWSLRDLIVDPRSVKRVNP